MNASQDYRDNMFGASYVSQFLKKKKKKDAEAAETVTCTRDGGHACGEERGEVRAGGDVKEGKTSSATGGEKNKVLTPKQAAKRKEEMEEKRKKAPAMRNLTKNQREELEKMGPPKPMYTKG
jgi:hypothetical protein